MSDKKKIAFAIVLIAVIIAAVAFTIVRQRRGTTQPEQVRQEEITMIDEESLEEFTAPREKWEGQEQQNYRWKNPKTGQYTLRKAMTCPACRKLIPGMVPGADAECPHCGHAALPVNRTVPLPPEE